MSEFLFNLARRALGQEAQAFVAPSPSEIIAARLEGLPSAHPSPAVTPVATPPAAIQRQPGVAASPAAIAPVPQRSAAAPLPTPATPLPFEAAPQRSAPPAAVPIVEPETSRVPVADSRPAAEIAANQQHVVPSRVSTVKPSPVLAAPIEVEQSPAATSPASSARVTQRSEPWSQAPRVPALQTMIAPVLHSEPAVADLASVIPSEVFDETTVTSMPRLRSHGNVIEPAPVSSPTASVVGMPKTAQAEPMPELMQPEPARRSLDIKIGTVEVRVSTPPAPAPVPAPSLPEGFESYSRVRNFIFGDEI